MADGGRVVIKIDGDNSGFKTAINSTSSLAKSSLSSFNSFSNSLGKGLATATAVGGAGLAVMANKAIGLASDLQEVQNVVDVTFGGNAGIIDQFALDAAKSFGLSELSVKQYTGTMGAMLKSMGLADQEVLDMSTDMVGLAGDFASFYNLDHEDAFYKIRAGIAGETEPLKALGINMSVANLEAYALSQGIETAYKSMTQAEQSTLRYNYLMSATADAQGDFARTSDSLANQTRIAQLELETLSATIGQALIPLMTEGTSTAGNFAKRLNDAFNADGATGLAEELGSIITDIVTDFSSQLPKFMELGMTFVKSLIESILANKEQLQAAAMETITYLASSLEEIIPMLGEVAELIVPSLITALINYFPLIWQLGLQILTALMTGISENLDSLIGTMQTVLENLLQAIITNLPILLEAAIQIIFALAQFLIDNVDLLIESALLIIDTLITFLMDNLPMLLRVAIELIIALINGILLAIPQLIAFIPQIILVIVDTLLANLGMIISAAIEIIMALISGLFTVLPNLLSAVGTLVVGIIDAFLSTDWLQVGWDILSGIANGILSAGDIILEAASTIVDSVIGAFTDLFGISSPAKKMIPIGKFVSQGVGQGLEDGTDSVLKSVDGQSQQIKAQYEKANLGDFSVQAFKASNLYTDLNNGVTQQATPVETSVSNIYNSEGTQNPIEETINLRIDLDGAPIYKDVVKRNKSNTVATGKNALGG